MVLFGATGDLTHRKLVPALYHLAPGGNLPGRVRDRRLRPPRLDRRRPPRRAARRRWPRTGGPDFDELWPQFATRIVFAPGTFDDPEALSRSSRRSSRSSTRPTAPAATGSSTWPSPPSSSPRSSTSLGEAGLIYPGAPGDALEPGGHREAVRPRPRQRPGPEPRRLAGARREPGLPDRPLPRQGDGPEHPGPAVRQRDLRADLEPAARRVGADHRGRGGRHGRRPRAPTTTPPARSATWSRTT